MSSQSRLMRVFKMGSVVRDAPATSGVYGLSNARDWIYIGATGNIKAQLLDHLQRTLPGGSVATGFFYELWSPEERVARQEQLIRELHPVCLARLDER